MLRHLIFPLKFFFLSLLVPAIALCDIREWKTISGDLEFTSKQSPILPSLFTQIYFLRSSLKEYQLRVIRASDFGEKLTTASKICEISRAAVCINASFFDEAGKPLGLVISNGTIYQNIQYGGQTLTGVFERSRNAMRISGRNEAEPSVALEAIQAGPRLIIDGEKVSLKKESAISTRRSGVCIDQEQRLVLFVAIPGILGFPLDKLVDLLGDEKIGCRNALNLDGGGSTQLYISSELPGAPSDHMEVVVSNRDEVPVFLGLFPNPPPQKGLPIDPPLPIE